MPLKKKNFFYVCLPNYITKKSCFNISGNIEGNYEKGSGDVVSAVCVQMDSYRQCIQSYKQLRRHLPNPFRNSHVKQFCQTNQSTSSQNLSFIVFYTGKSLNRNQNREDQMKEKKCKGLGRCRFYKNEVKLNKTILGPTKKKINLIQHQTVKHINIQIKIT